MLSRRWWLFFAFSVEYEHVPPDLDQRRVCLLGGFGGDGFGGFRLERAPEDFDFHLLVPLKLLVNLTRRLRSEAILANVDGGILLFQHVLNVAFHFCRYLAQFPSSPSFFSTGCGSANRS